MYFVDSLACSQPNSATPMPSAAVASQDARIAAVGSKFVNGNAALNTLINALGGDAVPVGAGNAGIPTTGVFPWFGIPSRNGSGGIPLSIGSGGGAPLVFTAAATPCAAPPRVLPLATVFPTPPVFSAPPIAPAPARPVSPLPVVTPASPAPAKADCRTGNICVDLRTGCVLQGQVSAQQLYACSAAGYAGNLNLFANPAGGGPFLGTPQANPAPFTGAGVGLFDAGAPWGLPEYALLGVGLYAAFGVVSSLMKEKRRRGVMRRMDF